MATARLIAATVCVVLLLRSPALAVDEIVDESTNVASVNFTLASQRQITPCENGNCREIQPTDIPCQECCSCVCCCPDWIVTPEAMFLSRRNSSPQTLITNVNTGAAMLSTRDFDDDYDVIPRLQLIRQECCGNGWEINLFGLSPFSTINTNGDSDSPNLAAPGIPLNSSAPGTIFRTSYDTDFNSLELNRRCYYNECLTFVAGFRWLELGEELDFDEVAPVQRDLFSVDTNNHMYGFQVGLDAVLWKSRRCFYIESGLRAAILHNSADQNIDAPFFTPVPLTVDRLSARDDHTAFFGELGIDGVYRLNSRVSLRAGYQLMWLEGVALAPDQIAVNSVIAPGIAGLDTSGSLFLSGVTVGATITF